VCFRWLAKNSSARKRARILGELTLHSHGATATGRTAFRLDYVSPLLSRFYSTLSSGDESGAADAIALLDAYGLSRDDMLEGMSELTMYAEEVPSLDSKVKAAFTRLYVDCCCFFCFVFFFFCCCRCGVLGDAMRSRCSAGLLLLRRL
jgi:replication factor C subunit 1